MGSTAATRDGAVTLVTGGVRGLGLACVRALRARGDRVVTTWCSSRARAEALADELEGRLYQVDLTDHAAARDLVETVVETEGRLDWVVHTVGDYRSGRLDASPPAELDYLWRSNVVTALNLVDAARPHLRSSGGGLVLFGCAGLAGLRARRDCAAYAAAKSALLVLARSWAVEEAPHGVRVNLVSPGLVPHDAAHPDTTSADLLASIPAGRPGTPAEVAAAVSWLTSDASAHTTGADLPVAGGWML